jgi:hypothetical protein
MLISHEERVSTVGGDKQGSVRELLGGARVDPALR